MVVAHSYSFIQWSSIVFVLNLVSSTTAAASDSSGNNNDGKCNACRFLVETFKRGIRETDNQHFAGGNTAWEEKKLGKFATSETRLVEVLEYACKDKDLPKLDGIVTGKDAEFKCQTLLEEHEESIENWYFHKQQANVGDMMSWLCIDTLKLCCASGHWGPQCKSCPGESSTQRIPCSARGSCDGDGTRSGTGKCKCDEGYVGLMCRKCDANYFIFFQNDTHIECNKCDQSCKGGCTADGAIGCNQCRSGWTMDSVHGCQDINECLDNPCDEADNYSCSNTPGSYVCVCREGYRMLNGKCQVDIIESDNDTSSDDRTPVADTDAISDDETDGNDAIGHDTDRNEL